MSDKAKKLAGERAAEFVENGQIVGLGTGSTAYFAIVKIGERVKEGIQVTGIPTSEASAQLANELDIPLADFSTIDRIDVTIDGADEVDHAFNLIKGGGGALLREKIVASATQTQIIVVDDSKLKENLGAFSLPVEVTPFGWQATQARISALGCNARLRTNEAGDPFVTDNANHILDCPFEAISDPARLESNLRSFPGVVECGLFVGLTDRVIIGNSDGTIRELSEPE
jgi:ribose 5-phosphate isomerase A